MGEAPQEFVAAIFLDDGLGDQRAELRHPVAQPAGYAAAVKRKIGAACSLDHVPYLFMNSLGVKWLSRRAAFDGTE
jgi:hypothetical protein